MPLLQGVGPAVLKDRGWLAYTSDVQPAIRDAFVERALALADAAAAPTRTTVCRSG